MHGADDVTRNCHFTGRNVAMTPPRLVQLKCPHCQSDHWEIDSDYRGATLVGQRELAYPERRYFCPKCRKKHPGYTVIQQSPPEFLLQPHDLYPMAKKDFLYWVSILQENFPDNPLLKVLGTEFYAGKTR